MIFVFVWSCVLVWSCVFVWSCVLVCLCVRVCFMTGVVDDEPEAAAEGAGDEEEIDLDDL